MAERRTELETIHQGPFAAGAATASAAANIAFIKYWGARDLGAAVPNNPSISMTLDRCRSRCRAIYRPQTSRDEILLVQGGTLQTAPASFAGRIVSHLDTLRALTGASGGFRIETLNTFPHAAGLASSASGFAALTLAVAGSLGLTLDQKTASLLARRSGSGSAARSTLGGYVEWPRGESEEESYAFLLLPATDWPLCDVIALVETGEKEVSSLEGHRRAPLSPHYRRRLELLPERLEAVRRALRTCDLRALGEVIEEEAIELHLIAMSSRPPIFYWRPATLAVLQAVRELRAAGVAAYATMDAGANVHVICEPHNEPAVSERLTAVPEVGGVLRDRVGPDPVVAREAVP